MKTYTLQFTEQELQILSKALAFMPYGEVAPLFASLQNQINKEEKAETDEE